MTEIIAKLTEPLPASEIEFRVGTTSYKTKGLNLLAYKTARVDVRRLNEVCGIYWKDKFFYDKKDNLCCKISIYDHETKQWIGRTDVGTESITEKEKGNYSDARKRAGFCWGIGAELYDFPFIWIHWDKWYKNEKTGKMVPKINTKGWHIEYVGKDIHSGFMIMDQNNQIIYSSKDKTGKKNYETSDDEASPKTDSPNTSSDDWRNVKYSVKKVKTPLKDINKGWLNFMVENGHDSKGVFAKELAYREKNNTEKAEIKQETEPTPENVSSQDIENIIETLRTKISDGYNSLRKALGTIKANSIIRDFEIEMNTTYKTEKDPEKLAEFLKAFIQVYKSEVN